MRWLVGDIQGCAREFDDLLSGVGFDPGRDQLWCLGDLVNRGPDSLASVRLWRDVGGRGLLGNHDIYALLARSGTKRRKDDTLDSLFEAHDGDELLGRLRRQAVLVQMAPAPDGRPISIVHAGVDPRWDDLDRVARRLGEGDHDDEWLQSDEVSFATRVRCCDQDGALCRHTGPPETCPAPFRPWDQLYCGEALIVHGHWARRGYYRNRRTMGLDSGCVYGGSLTAWCPEEDRIVQIRSRLASGSAWFDLGKKG